MEYKAIFLDLDGTLLNGKGRISNRTKNCILEAQKFGVQIVINSGRMPLEIQRILSREELRLSYIALNGAYVYDAKFKKLIFKDMINQEVRAKVLDLCKQRNICSYWYGCDKMYTEYRPPNIREFRPDARGIFEAVMGANGYLVKMKRLEDIVEPQTYDITKGAVLCSNADQMHFLRKELTALDLLEVSSSSARFLEFNSRGISKGSGMNQFLNYYHINSEKSIAVGDHENDIPMIQAAGLGVAMGNAIRTVKETADFVTAANYRNGVAKVLQKFVL